MRPLDRAGATLRQYLATALGAYSTEFTRLPPEATPEAIYHGRQQHFFHLGSPIYLHQSDTWMPYRTKGRALTKFKIICSQFVCRLENKQHIVYLLQPLTKLFHPPITAAHCLAAQ